MNSLTCKGIAEPCLSWINWFAGQYRLKVKYARPIAENRLSPGTKLKMEHFFKTCEDLVLSPELIFDAGETMVKTSDIDGWNCPKRCQFLRLERISQISWMRQWKGISGSEQRV
jgi:hypothetical protein